MKRAFLRTTVIAIMFLGVILSLPWDVVQARVDQDQPLTPPRTLPIVKMYIKEDGTLTPERPDPRDSEPQLRAIPSRYVKTGLFGFGVLPFVQTDWAVVGKFETNSLRHPMFLGGKINFIMWAKTDSGTATADIRFTLLREGEVLVTATVNDARIASDPVKITAKGDLGLANDTYIPAGSKLVFQIESKTTYDNAAMLYGTTQYDTGFTFYANSLEILTASMCKSSVTMEYTDSFYIPVNKMFYQCVVDGYVLSAQRIETELNTSSFAWRVRWVYPIDPGDHHVEVSVGYDPQGFGNVTKSFDLTLRDVRVNQFVVFMKAHSTSFIGVIILLLLLYVLYAKKVKPKRVKTPKRKLTKAEKKALKREKKLRKKAKKMAKKGKKLPSELDLDL
ncbi:hypothetical protein DRJ54_04485 [Candidatus Acetothermia bacterium]|nr:MAG: hypothetical protein DRJ54_04485 [Candidatus Acetothermia bacterium]